MMTPIPQRAAAGRGIASRRLVPLLHCAIANKAWSLVLAAACAFALGCADEASGSASSGETSASADLAEFVEVLKPLKETVTSDITDKRFIRRQELLAKLRGGDRAVGLQALEQLKRVQSLSGIRLVEIEAGLLDVAAHAAPEDTRTLLISLVTQYGTSLGLRTEAALLLADTSPEEAIPVLEPWVTRTRPTQTMPPAEFLVRAWVIACDHTGRSPVKELANVATNLFQDDAARIRAVNELRRYKEPLASQALQTILVESTGNGYLRRKAAQGLRELLPVETACAIFEHVAEREADLNFAKFLADMLDKHCHR